MQLCIYEDGDVEKLEPVSLTRPLTQLWLGTSTLLHKFLDRFRPSGWGLWLRPQFVALAQELFPDIPINDLDWLCREATLLVNARWIPPINLDIPQFPHIGLCSHQVVYLQLAPELTKTWTPDWLENLSTLTTKLPTQPVAGFVLCKPWDIVAIQESVLADETAHWAMAGCNTELPAGIYIQGDPHRVYLDPSVVLEPPITLNTEHGAIVLDRHVQVHAFSRLEGPCYVGPHSVILGARIRRGTSIGPGCRIGGEVEASVFQGWANKYHDGFVGHSWVGEWVNLAAGVQISDLRHDYKTVSVTYRCQRQDSGLLKLGALIADHTKLGLGVLVNTGSIFGIFCSVLPGPSYVPNYVPSFCNYVRGELRACSDIEGCLEIASRVMRRRQHELSPALCNIYRYVYMRTAGERLSLSSIVSKWALRATA